MKKGPVVTFKIIKKYEPSKTDVRKKYHEIFSMFPNTGSEITIKNFYKIHGKHLFPSCTTDSAKTILSTCFKTAISIGILEKVDDQKSTPDWFSGLESISYWQSLLRGSKFTHLKKDNNKTTKKNYLYGLWRFNKWLVLQTVKVKKTRMINESIFEQKIETTKFQNVEELLHHLDSPFTKSGDVIKIIKKFLTDPMHEGNSTINANFYKNSILSYFETNDNPIPFKFNFSAIYDDESSNLEDEDNTLSLDEFMKILVNSNPSITEKSVFLTKFHRGLDASTLVDRFNFEAWDQLTKHFECKRI